MKPGGGKHDGHRQRMIQKAKDAGMEFLPEHEQLEILLYAVIARGNTNGIAIDLIQRFGSIASVLSASPMELKKVDGIGDKAANFLSQMPDYLGIVQRSQLFEKKLAVLETTEEMGNYVQTLFHHKLVETCYLISLSHTGRVIRFDKISEGTPDETAVYVRKIAKCAVINEASSVVLAHNHPGRTLEPTFEDIQRTREVYEALHSLEIPLRDHFIVAGGSWLSMREEQLMNF